MKEGLIDIFFAVLTDGIVLELVCRVSMDKAKVGHWGKDLFKGLGAKIPEGDGGVVVIAAGDDVKVPGDLENRFALFFDDGAEALFFRRIVLATITVVVKFSVFEKWNLRNF